LDYQCARITAVALIQGARADIHSCRHCCQVNVICWLSNVIITDKGGTKSEGEYFDMDVEGSNSEDVNIEPKAVGKKNLVSYILINMLKLNKHLVSGKNQGFASDNCCCKDDASSWEGYWQEVMVCDHGLPGSDVRFIRSKADKTASSLIPNWKQHLKSMQQGAERLKPALGELKDSDAFAKQPKFQATKLSQAIQFNGK
jgi:hypothetical protein